MPKPIKSSTVFLVLFVAAVAEAPSDDPKIRANKIFSQIDVNNDGELSEEEFLADCKHLDLSVDGVQETKHGKRKFVFVTVRFGGRAIYILKVLNPLLKLNQAKASPDTLIGFVM